MKNKTGKIIKFLFLAALAVTLFNADYAGHSQRISMTPKAFAANCTATTTPASPASCPSGQGLSPDGCSCILQTIVVQQPLDYKDLLQKIAATSTLVNNLFNPIIHFFTFRIGAFLGNDYIYSGNMGAMLKVIWIISRNLVNIVFVLVLLALAIMQIFKSQGESSPELKKLLPQFILMMIAVNFSWLVTKVVLDAANIATNVVFSIPVGANQLAIDAGIKPVPCTIDVNGKRSGFCAQDMFLYNLRGTEPGKAADILNLPDTSAGMDKLTGVAAGAPTACPKASEVYVANGLTPDGNPIIAEGETTAEPADTYADKTSPYYGKSVVCWHTMDLSKYNQNSASMFISSSMARVQDLTNVKNGGDVAKISIGILFALIIQIIYIISFACLFIALVIRSAMLWIFVAFSPVIVLLMALEEMHMEAGGLGEHFGFKKFLGWAFAPTKVAAVWSVGFLMITAGQTMLTTGKPNIFDTLNNTGFININTLFLGMDNLQEFIWLIMTVGIIWIGTFSVFSELDVVKSITDPIKGVGESAAGWVAKSPTLAPIIPIYGKDGSGKRQSINQMLGTMKKPFEDWAAEGKYHEDKDKKAIEAGNNIKNNSAKVLAELKLADPDNKVAEIYKKHADWSDLDQETAKKYQAHIKLSLTGAGMNSDMADTMSTKIIKGLEISKTAPTPGANKKAAEAKNDDKTSVTPAKP